MVKDRDSSQDTTSFSKVLCLVSSWRFFMTQSYITYGMLTACFHIALRLYFTTVSLRCLLLRLFLHLYFCAASLPRLFSSLSSCFFTSSTPGGLFALRFRSPLLSSKLALHQQSQDRLRGHVCLRQHRRSRLLQDIESRQI